ncbi:MAG: glycosyltransferase family 9 protein [Chloroflexi bacterium]|nr:glycosyltransferase family 9 protein [Chloroflexota bacterium]
MATRTLRQRIRLHLLRLIPYLTWPLKPRRKHPLIGSPSVARILLIRPDHLGDLLFTTPALRLLREAFPQARITCLVGPWAKVVIENNPHLDEIALCPFPGFTCQKTCPEASRRKRSIIEPYVMLLQYARQLRQRNFDLAVVLRFDHWWGALLAYLAGIPRRVGYDVAEVRPFLTDVVPYSPHRHEVEQNLVLVEQGSGTRDQESGIRARGVDWPLEFQLTAEDETFANSYLAGHGVEDGDLLVGIHPGAGAAVKLWRNEAWAQVADVLAQRYGAKVILTGSAEESPLCRAIAEGMTSNPIVAAGETSLGELAAIMARCRLVLGVDSGPLHLAVAVGTPTVHLFGPVDSRAFGPWGDPARHIVVTSEMDCIPCNRLDYAPAELYQHPCVRNITAEQILEAVERLSIGSGTFDC